eukprot:EG_transcript_17134
MAARPTRLLPPFASPNGQPAPPRPWPRRHWWPPVALLGLLCLAAWQPGPCPALASFLGPRVHVDVNVQPRFPVRYVPPSLLPITLKPQKDFRPAPQGGGALFQRSATNLHGTPPQSGETASSAAPWQRALPNALSVLRCLAVPVLVALFYRRPYSPLLAGGLFVLTCLTDLLDGYLARRWAVTSAFGAFLDPVADKLMVAAVLVVLAGRYGAAVALPAAAILVREIAVSALREWMAEQGLRNVVQVGFAGKCKTAMQMVALTLLLAVPHPLAAAAAAAPPRLLAAGYAALHIAAVLTLVSGTAYFTAAWPHLSEDSKP